MGTVYVCVMHLMLRMFFLGTPLHARVMFMHREQTCLLICFLHKWPHCQLPCLTQILLCTFHAPVSCVWVVFVYVAGALTPAAQYRTLEHLSFLLQILLGTLHAPVGCVCVVFMYVAGASTLLADCPEAAAEAFSMFHEAVAEELWDRCVLSTPEFVSSNCH